MDVIDAAMVMAAVLLSAGLTWLVRRLSLAIGILDLPNARSSHSTATPRGGGLAIVVVFLVFMILLLALDRVDHDLCFAILGGGFLIATVGYMDDRRSLSPAVRLCAYAIATLWALWMLGGIPPLQLGTRAIDLGWGGDLLGFFVIVWLIILYNFMDGIDGIAASETLFVCLAGAGLALLDSSGSEVLLPAVGLAAATLGFLVWNWPPAKIFMGDVGSTFLGFVIAMFAVSAGGQRAESTWVWLILVGVFVVDATVTLIRRVLRRTRAFEAHRTHAYQWMARRWKSHLAVTAAVVALDVVWLLPLGWLATTFPADAWWIAVLALLPLVPVALLAGAGKVESQQTDTVEAR